MKQVILQAIVDHLIDNDYDADLEDDMIFIDYGDATVSIQDDDIALSFNLSCSPFDIARITKLIVEANAKYDEYTVEIYEPYMDLFNANDDYLDTLWGESAFKYLDDMENIISKN